MIDFQHFYSNKILFGERSRHGSRSDPDAMHEWVAAEEFDTCPPTSPFVFNFVFREKSNTERRLKSSRPGLPELRQIRWK